MKAFEEDSLRQNSSLPTPVQQGVSSASDSNRDKQTPGSNSVTSPNQHNFRDRKIGFLGATSFSAVFKENDEGRNLVGHTSDVEGGPSLAPLTAEKIQQGAEILMILRDMPLFERFTARWFDFTYSIVTIQAFFRIWIDEMWAQFGDTIQYGSPDELRSLSELVWRNTRKPMKTSGDMTAPEWVKSASGRNLRWEVVGIILSIVGLIVVNLSNWDSIFDSVRDKFVSRVAFADRMRRASEKCLFFCYDSEVLNDIYVFFMYEDLILVECVKGDVRKFPLRHFVPDSTHKSHRLRRMAAHR